MADGDNLVMGQFNSSNAETHIARSTYSYGGPVPIHSAALDVTNVDGTGVRAYSPNREAVYGHGGETGVYGYSAGSTGVHGRSPYGTGVRGESTNNAGVQGEIGTNVATAPLDEAHLTMETNLFGPWRLIQELLPLLRESRRARIVNVSSGAGQLSDMNGGYPGYRVSKSALNALTRVLSNEEPGVLVNSMCPGWVRTDMGGAGAPRSVEEGADTAVWLATLPDDGPTGGFFRNREPISW